MIDFSLFLGLASTPAFEEKLQKLNPYFLSHWTGGGPYLHEQRWEELRVIGKPLSSIVSLQELEDLEANVLSLLKRLVPDYLYQNHPLSLFALSADDEF